LISAEDAGKALDQVGTKLAQAGILSWDGQQVLSEEAGRLRKLRQEISWEVLVDRARPVVFEKTLDKNGHIIRPSIDGADIRVRQTEAPACPIIKLDASVLIADHTNEPVARWHVDRANTEGEAQHGPLYHLQFGGHLAGRRDLDIAVKEPRWCHPPLEIALLCEVVAANFFHDIWRDQIRDDASWCAAIRLFQKLCFTAYIEKMQSCLGASHSTALTQMWADRWT